MLDSYVAIYVPSNSNGSVVDNAPYVEDALRFLSGLFGGATAQNAKGAWVNDDNALVLEDVVIVKSFASKDDIRDNFPKVKRFARSIKRKLAQEAVSLESAGILEFV